MVEMDLVEHKEKKFVAMSSVIAAIFLTSGKLLVGLLTGSLGILSEALHSGLDLIAALMTFFAVKFADKPADTEHHYGHGKIENLSALFETMLLLVTCFWIIYEATNRLLTGKTEIEVNVWSFVVIISSIIIDFSRSRALMKIAKKYNSQALEADALHFSTDIASSAVVIVGLVGALFNYHFADSLAALIVAVIVLYVCYKLGKRSIDDLLDKSPRNMREKILALSADMPQILQVHDIKIRTSGSRYFVELSIHVDPVMTIEQAHGISHMFEEKIIQTIGRTIVHVHIEPDEIHE